jgi:hypothetical protein
MPQIRRLQKIASPKQTNQITGRLILSTGIVATLALQMRGLPCHDQHKKETMSRQACQAGEMLAHLKSRHGGTQCRSES